MIKTIKYFVSLTPYVMYVYAYKTLVQSIKVNHATLNLKLKYINLLVL